jgi:hypothetical protein
MSESREASKPSQPSIVPLDSGGKQYEWHIRQFDIEVCFNKAGVCDGVFVTDLVTGYTLEWDDHEGLDISWVESGQSHPANPVQEPK